MGAKEERQVGPQLVVDLAHLQLRTVWWYVHREILCKTGSFSLGFNIRSTSSPSAAYPSHHDFQHSFIYIVLVGTRELHARTRKDTPGCDPSLFSRVCDLYSHGTLVGRWDAGTLLYNIKEQHPSQP